MAFVSGPGIAKAGGIGRAYVSVADIAPTLLDYADLPSRGTSFEGRSVQPVTGKSARPWLEGKAASVRAADEPIGMELFGSRSLRKGNWKLTDIGDGQWRLFDVERDPGETHDLSGEYPGKVVELASDWDEYAKENNVILPGDVKCRP